MINTRAFSATKKNTKENGLRKVVTDNAGLNLQRAAAMLHDDKLLVCLNAAVNPGDAHAIDVMYHVQCWAKNVTNLLRKEKSTNDNIRDSHEHIATAASEVEFQYMLHEALLGGNVYSMGTLEHAYNDICVSNNVDKSCVMSRKQLKRFIEIELSDDGVEFSRPKRLNEQQRVSLKCTRDAILSDIESSNTHKTKTLQICTKQQLSLEKLF